MRWSSHSPTSEIAWTNNTRMAVTRNVAGAEGIGS